MILIYGEFLSHRYFCPRPTLDRFSVYWLLMFFCFVTFLQMALQVELAYIFLYKVLVGETSVLMFVFLHISQRTFGYSRDFHVFTGLFDDKCGHLWNY